MSGLQDLGGAARVLRAVRDHAARLGRFENVIGHEPKSAPGNGLVYASWVQDLRPIPLASGLDSVTARLEVRARVYMNMLAEPQDGIDPRVLDAVDRLMAAYVGDFTLGGLVRDVDMFGEHGDPLAAEAGYLEQDRKMYRVMVITLPLILNDLWPQVP